MHFMHQTANKALRHKALPLVYVLVHKVHKIKYAFYNTDLGLEYFSS